MEFVEQPKAISTLNALYIESGVIISRGRISFSRSSIIFIPACLASLILSEYTAGIVPLPGRAIPRTSQRQFIEFAVNIPEHEPHEGQAASSSSKRPDSSIVPALNAPTASNAVLRSRNLPPKFIESIGPPEQIIAGILRRAAAMSIPGTILSQLGIRTSASKP